MRIGIGQDSHAFIKKDKSTGQYTHSEVGCVATCNDGCAVACDDGCAAVSNAGYKERKLVLGGIIFDNHVALEGNSDADVVLHALTNAISGITCINILGKTSDEMCLEQGITDSREYLKVALSYFTNYRISNVSISIECLRPKIAQRVDEMRMSIASLLETTPDRVGITATTGEGLTAFGRGEGISVFATVLAEEI